MGDYYAHHSPAIFQASNMACTAPTNVAPQHTTGLLHIAGHAWTPAAQPPPRPPPPPPPTPHTLNSSCVMKSVQLPWKLPTTSVRSPSHSL